MKQLILNTHARGRCTALPSARDTIHTNHVRGMKLDRRARRRGAGNRQWLAVLPLLLLASACLGLRPAGVLPADLEVEGLIPEPDADCDRFKAKHITISTGDAFEQPSLDSRVQSADEVARAGIEAVLPARYFSVDGPDDGTGSWIFRPIVLSVVERYKGDPEVAGYVVLRMGGCDRRRGIRFESEPEILTGGLRDEGVAFLSAAPADWETDPPNWYLHLEHAARQRSSESARYAPMPLVDDWYRFEGGKATSALMWSEEPRPIDSLTSELRRLMPDER